MYYTVKRLAGLAGVSVRTLHFYDQIGLLRPQLRTGNRYRQYGEQAIVRLQQIMFFRELGFSLDEIGLILAKPDFDLLDALQSHRMLLSKKRERIDELLSTVDKTIMKLKGEAPMGIQEYYQGFSEEQIESYRNEVRQRWGEKTLKDSEERIMKMGRNKFDALQAQGGKIFQAIADNMSAGHDSEVVQGEVAKWRRWLENFHHYSDEAVLGLGRGYSQHPDFITFFEKYHKGLPVFLTTAIEHYCSTRE